MGWVAADEEWVWHCARLQTVSWTREETTAFVLGDNLINSLNVTRRHERALERVRVIPVMQSSVVSKLMGP